MKAKFSWKAIFLIPCYFLLQCYFFPYYSLLLNTYSKKVMLSPYANKFYRLILYTKSSTHLTEKLENF